MKSSVNSSQSRSIHLIQKPLVLPAGHISLAPAPHSREDTDPSSTVTREPPALDLPQRQGALAVGQATVKGAWLGDRTPVAPGSCDLASRNFELWF